MEELIKGLRKATGPDRSLDWEIHCRNGMDGVGAYGAHPHYTESLDAAMTLVPPQCWGEISWSGVLGGGENARKFPIVTLGPGEDGRKTQAQTIPLAICIAALLARSGGDRT